MAETSCCPCFAFVQEPEKPKKKQVKLPPDRFDDDAMQLREKDKPKAQLREKDKPKAPQAGTVQSKPAATSSASAASASSAKNASSGQPTPQAAAGQSQGKAVQKTAPPDKKADKLENKKFEDTLKFLEKVPLMTRLPRDKLPIVTANVEPRKFKAGDEIIKQGERGQEFFIILQGEASVSVSHKGKVNELKKGDFFGENSLLRDEPRLATITANTDIECLSLTRAKFEELGLNKELHFPKRQAVGVGVKDKPALKKEPSPKSDDDRAFIADAFKRNEDLQGIVTLDEDRIQRLIDVAWKEEIAAGELIIEEGDADSDYFYVIQNGSAAVETDPTSPLRRSRRPDEPSGSRTMTKGDSFGELALLYAMPRTATVRAEENCTLWVVDRHSFKTILMRATQEQIRRSMRLLDRVEILETLTNFEKQQIAEALVEMHFSKGEVVLRQGDTDTGFYIMREGEVSVSVDGKEVRRLPRDAASESEVQFFGEKALLKNDVRTATVEVTSEKAVMLVLDRDTFELVLRPLEEIIKNSRQGRRPTDGDILLDDSKVEEKRRKTIVARKSGVDPDSVDLSLLREKIDREDLMKIGLLGVGGFGIVELLVHKVTGDTFAMKVMSKGYIVKQHMQGSIVNEKRILSMLDSPFIIKLFGTYNMGQQIHFLMEPALGGELYATYHFRGFHGLPGHARYYSAGVVRAFEYLHERHVVYRDLKPENLLLNDKGHLKLTDMGLAKFVIGRTYTTCGTPDYFAPEVIASHGHNRGVDWWCLGILIFEMLAGRPPFESSHPMHIYAKVRKGIGKIIFPQKCRGPVENLIKGLLQNNPSDRLPMKRGGIEMLEKHEWYASCDFNWAEHASGKMVAPYRPKVQNATDISNFRPRKDDAPPMLEWKDDGSGWDREF